ncbi:vomeronasal type-2 receptor 26 [Bombina bombina]|uniref:vomeronasal type-2 receptor 26 n=1 Tax=Bombina bombina TaxID=8345 RepID=UPI00235ACA48|nr:vomeronasal type-2 receptor 26 [Bombina bombina]
MEYTELARSAAEKLLSYSKDQSGWKLCKRTLNDKLRDVDFTTLSGDKISFTNERDVPGLYEIINWVVTSDFDISANKVGIFNPSAPAGQQLAINNEDIHWNSQVLLVPRSVCSNSCAPGYRKVPLKQRPVCCYICAKCPEGEISNITDAENCVICPEDQWSNERRDKCISRTMDFLSHEDLTGVLLISLCIIFCIMASSVMGIFIKHHETPIVKANNRNLSYSLLISLILSFLCSLLFIGRPVTVTCLLRQAAFGVIFTVSVSCVLAKSITVVIAFNATKPGSKIKKWVGSQVSMCLVIVCSLGQVVTCTVWLSLCPPYPDYDTQTDTGKMILLCNEGCVPAFYTVIGYLGFLSALSFLVAFLVRKLPASFNEAQLITFSMLVFCSVWLSFIPAYLSTKGKYMVAVEIFAILASSAGLLGCIFIPKCYIILVKPEINTREYVFGKQ